MRGAQAPETREGETKKNPGRHTRHTHLFSRRGPGGPATRNLDGVDESSCSCRPPLVFSFSLYTSIASGLAFGCDGVWTGGQIPRTGFWDIYRNGTGYWDTAYSSRGWTARAVPRDIAPGAGRLPHLFAPGLGSDRAAASNGEQAESETRRGDVIADTYTHEGDSSNMDSYLRTTRPPAFAARFPPH